MSSAEPAVGQNTDSSESPKIGRPLKFQSVEELQKAIDDYFAECNPHWIDEEYWEYPLKGGDRLEGQPQGGALKRNGVAEPDYDAEPVLKKRKVMSEQVPYTTTGLALALDTNRHTLLDYGDGKYDKSPDDPDYDPLGTDFSHTIKKAKARVERYAELYLYGGKNVAGAIFNLKNNHGWVDKQIEEGTQEIIITTRKHKADGGR